MLGFEFVLEYLLEIWCLVLSIALTTLIWFAGLLTVLRRPADRGDLIVCLSWI